MFLQNSFKMLWVLRILSTIRMFFGITSAPTAAQFAVLEVAEKIKETHPEGHFYVHNCRYIWMTLIEHERILPLLL